MQALKELFTTDVGLMSVIGLGIMFGVGGFFYAYVFRHMREDGERAAKQRKD